MQKWICFLKKGCPWQKISWPGIMFLRELKCLKCLLNGWVLTFDSVDLGLSCALRKLVAKLPLLSLGVWITIYCWGRTGHWRYWTPGSSGGAKNVLVLAMGAHHSHRQRGFSKDTHGIGSTENLSPVFNEQHVFPCLWEQSNIFPSLLQQLIEDV